MIIGFPLRNEEIMKRTVAARKENKLLIIYNLNFEFLINIKLGYMENYNPLELFK